MLSTIIKIVIISSSIACLETKSPVLIDGIDIYDGKRMTIEGVKEPPAPDYRENAKTLKGIDSNNNGMRDDVERWINRRFPGDDKKSKVLRRLSKVIYDSYSMTYKIKFNKKTIINHLDHLTLCKVAVERKVTSYSPKTIRHLESNLKSLIINTKKRLKKFEKLNDFMHGTKIELADIDRATELCDEIKEIL